MELNVSVSQHIIFIKNKPTCFVNKEIHLSFFVILSNST